MVARPKKQTIEYFPHYVNHHKTIFVLESKFGNDGYAFWFKLLELLGSTNGMFYDCNNVAEWEFLLAKTHVNNETANNILNTLSDLDAIDAELWESGIIWVSNLVENVRDAFKRRLSDMPQKPLLHTETPGQGSLCIQKPSESEDTADINRESKLKESKVKETKTKEESCGSSNPDFNIFLYMQKCGFVSISPVMMEKIDTDIEMYSLEEVKIAVEIADNAGKHSYAYVKGILEKRRSEGGDKHGSDKQGNENSSANDYDFSKYTG
jgi:hypothetical protein